ncbi:metallophosphoesterase [Mucisphaera calidilacus]|uniref:Calcineurin-like phosphoesterase domain-containing protein n=1 Tax=Mucisphaera calidilacus TaxID=2527982 RepID=A0A518BTU7_9BACT|nr:metallophosphoesterase [Mucisphaera calidilacus]QDU70402.1 hypothetical protein Pan265_02290 [Mucisphaera calidilacus]
MMISTRHLVYTMTMAYVALIPSAEAFGASYTVAVLPDTQYYAQLYPETFDAQTQWLADQASSRNIVFTTHLGDIVEYGANLGEWVNADTSMGYLDAAGMNYSVTPGNHDLYGDGGVNYRHYFGASRFASMPTYGGHSASAMSQYHVVSMGDQDILMLSVDIDAPDAELAWAQSVLDAHPDTPAILSTHLLMDNNGNIRDTTYIRHGYGNPAQTIWDELVMPNAQVFMTLNGHYHGTRAEVSYNAAGLAVHRVLVDYQGLSNGGDGYLRLMEFDFDADVIRHTSYSPTLDQSLTDPGSSFDLEVDFERRFANQRDVVPAGTLIAGTIYDFSSAESRKGDRSVDQLVTGAGIVGHLGQERVELDSVHASGTYDSAADGMWTNFYGQPIDEQFIVFDLGQVLNLDQVAIWQFGEAFSSFDFSDQGARDLRILVSDVLNPVAGDFAEIGTIRLEQYVQGEDLVAQVFDLEGAEGVRYVRFEFEDNWGGTGYVGLSEVRFVTGAPVPEPVSAALLGFGLAGVLSRRGCRGA